ncbi:MAG: prepilin-type N-terminal cleavage/methylation domain-containing protein [Desulfatirhabdiaceae bacterium]
MRNQSANANMKGFTLIELMIVLAIIGVLAAMAVSIFSGYDCITKQSEAKSSLSTIHKAQIAYFSEYNMFSTSLSAISFSLKGNQLYTYDAGGNGATFSATATNGPNGDAWSIDQDKNLINTSKGCPK